MKFWFHVAILPVLLFSAARAAENRELPPVYLAQGEQRLIHVPGLQRYSLGGPAVRIVPFPSDHEALLVKGVQPGISDIWVWRSDGNADHRVVQVDPHPSLPLKRELAQALGGLNEAEIVYSGAGVVLRGELQSASEGAKVAALARAFPNDVHDETLASENLAADGLSRLQGWLKSSPYSSRLSVFREDRLVRVSLVSGSLRNPAEREVIEKRIHAIYPLAQVELDVLPDASPTVHFRVFLLELRRSRFHSLGLSWPAIQEGAFRVTTSSITDMMQLDLALQTLEGEGSLKILSNPELVVRAPGEAELFSGGEIPIQARSAYYSSVTWKSFGLTLKLNVTQSAGDKVRLDIMTEVSHLDSSLSNEKIPGIQANRMKTQVDAQYGQPLLLSGLLQQNVRNDAKGLPFLREIPVLGALFGSEDYLNERSELVAILVPSAELPKNPMDRIAHFLPKGTLPLSREPARPDWEREAEKSANFPWNVLQ